ncbi:MAG: hypothetical protein WBD22_14690, partial [Pyrinomonadaceae bacterium]
MIDRFITASLFIFLICAPIASQKPEEAKTSGDSPEAQLMAYFAISKASDQIAEIVCKDAKDAKTIAIYDSEMRKQIIEYRAIRDLFSHLTAKFNRLNKYFTSQAILGLDAEDPKAAASGGESSSLNFIANPVNEATDLIGKFKTEVVDQPLSLDVTKDQLIPEVTSSLRKKCPDDVQIFNPKEIPLSLRMEKKESELFTSLDKLYALRAKAKESLKSIPAGLAKKRSEVALELESMKDTEKIKSLEANLDSIDSALSNKQELEGAIAQFDAVEKGLISTTKEESTPLLLRLREAEAIVEFTKSPGSYILEVGSNVAGSTRREKKNLFLEVFTPTSRIRFNGVAAIRYTLYDHKGSIKSSCVMKAY